MLAHYERGRDLWQPGKGPHFASFPETLHAFLIRTGYYPPLPFRGGAGGGAFPQARR